MFFLFLSCFDRAEFISHSENSCGPADGAATDITIGITKTDTCLGDTSPTPLVHIFLYSEPTKSGEELVMGGGIVGADGLAYQSTEAGDVFVVEGTVILEWEGTWETGTEYTGSYSLELEEEQFIEGTFEGTHCGGEISCG